MTDTADLVQRLRELQADIRRWVYESALGDGHEPSRLLRKARDELAVAADALSSLTRKLEEARKLLQDCESTLAGMSHSAPPHFAQAASELADRARAFQASLLSTADGDKGSEGQ